MKVRFADDDRNYAQRRDDRLRALHKKLFWADIKRQLPELVAMAVFLTGGIVVVSFISMI